MKRVVIYGTGKVGRFFYERHDFVGEELVGFIETIPEKETFLNMPVGSVEKLEKDIDLVYMANSNVNTIYAAIKNGIPKDRMIIENAILYKDYCQVEGMADISYDYVMAEQYEKYITKPKYVVTSTMLKDMKIYNSELQTEGEMAVIVSRDYCRYATLELLIEQIREESV